MRVFLLIIGLALGLNLFAQDRFDEKIKAAFEALKGSTGGEDWKFKTIDDLKGREKSPKIIIEGPQGGDIDTEASYYFTTLDLCNNGLVGEVKLNFILDEKYDHKKSYLNAKYYSLAFSHNKLTKVDSKIGFGWNGLIPGGLHLDNNELKEYTADLESASWNGLYTGASKLSLHQNELTQLKGSDIAKIWSPTATYILKALLANDADYMRVDNNRLNFDCLVDLAHWTKIITGRYGHNTPGNPDFVFDCYPQKALGGDATEEILAEGSNKTLSFSLVHPENVYNWELNGKLIPLSEMKEFTYTVNEERAGVWRCKVTNPKLPGVHLYSYDMAVFMQKDGNKAANDIKFIHNSITENYPEAAVVGSFQAQDPDGDKLYYRLHDKTADNSHFRIINGQTLVSAETLFEKHYLESYTIVVEAYDIYGGKFEKEFVINKGEAGGTPFPSDITLSANKTPENVIDQLIGEISIKGVEAAHGYKAKLKADELDNNKLKINAGKLYTAVELDYEKETKLQVRITAEATDGTSIQKDFDLVVTDANDAPHDIVLTNNTIVTLTASGSIVAYTFASDQDPGDKAFTYSLSEGYADNKHFVIHDNQLKVKTKFTEAASLNIGITATDDENASFTKGFQLNVLSEATENLPPVSAGMSNTFIPYGSELGYVVGQLNLSDPEGATGSFTCTNEFFEIQGAVVKLKKVPAAGSVNQLEASCSDGENTIKQVFSIKSGLKSLENAAPIGIGLTNTIIYNNLKPGDVVATIYMADPNGDQGAFSLDDDSFVSIDGNKLKLVQKTPAGEVLQLKITGKDEQGETITQTLDLYTPKETTNTNSIQQNMVSFYPNPVMNTLFVTEPGDIKLWNAQGQLLVAKRIENKLDLSSFEAGVYLIAFENEKGYSEQKIIKK